ncbi:lipase/acyltransferase domain-containing protein [Providencia sneebia]|uniref:Lecithin:cholesterol acyltransferase n=1 Tax=Providencia sneebia DSM 19967 TaxID=1141660 RepID=K8WHL7_9GAMM|nr:hypothetical protein [Providencia sneebia]EKT60039.1 hypothetical protein OO7_04374 [Providencia sneebia DSM 19967]
MPLNWGLAMLQAKKIAKQLRNTELKNTKLNLPIIYLPGIMGSQLYDRQKKTLIWGDYKSLIRKNDYEYHHSPSQIGANQLHYFPVIPKLYDNLITAPLKLVLEKSLGYRDGVDLFFLGHDWRADHRQLAELLDTEIRRIKYLYGEQQKFLLIAHSASNCAIRYYLQSASPEIRQSIAKWYAFGPPWQGTFQSLALMQSGYYAGGRLFHGFTADEIASCPSAYQLLPCFPQLIDKQGNLITDFDIYDEECWKAFHLGPYRMGVKKLSDQQRRVRDQLAENLFSAKTFAERVSTRTVAEQAVPQTWFISDNHITVKRAIYDQGRLYLTASDIPNLIDMALTKGDDHLPLDGLLMGWEKAIVRDGEPQPFGEEYVFINQAKTHRALVSYMPNLRSLALDIATLRQRYAS